MAENNDAVSRMRLDPSLDPTYVAPAHKATKIQPQQIYSEQCADHDFNV